MENPLGNLCRYVKSIIRALDRADWSEEEKMSLVDNNRFLEAPAYWRREDVLRLWQGRDDESKRRLTKFRPFNAQFLVEHSIRLPSFANSSSESMEHWQWSLPIEEEDVCVIASKHMRESLELFPLISFREWVREALELSPTTIWCFRGKIRSLSWVVFSYLAPRPEVGPEYLTSIVCFVIPNCILTRWLLKSPGQIDPFTRAAIENACNCVRSGQYSESDLVLGFQFITEPLKKLLYQPSSVHDILQQLEVLEVRFKNWYHSSEDWPGRFDIETPFLKDLSHSSPTSLALRMSKEDHLQFQDLNRRRLKALDNSQLFSPINSWWNDRCRVAQECSAAGDKITSKLVKLVRVSWRNPQAPFILT